MKPFFLLRNKRRFCVKLTTTLHQMEAVVLIGWCVILIGPINNNCFFLKFNYQLLLLRLRLDF